MADQNFQRPAGLHEMSPEEREEWLQKEWKRYKKEDRRRQIRVTEKWQKQRKILQDAHNNNPSGDSKRFQELHNLYLESKEKNEHNIRRFIGELVRELEFEQQVSCRIGRFGLGFFWPIF